MKKAAAQDPIRFAPGIGYVYALKGDTAKKAREILRQELERRKIEGYVDVHSRNIRCPRREGKSD